MWRSWISRASEPAEIVRGRLVAVAFQIKMGPFERVWFASLYATTDSEAARSAQLRAFGSWHGEQSWPVVLGGLPGLVFMPRIFQVSKGAQRRERGPRPSRMA